jgi:hypothetical protein
VDEYVLVQFIVADSAPQVRLLSREGTLSVQLSDNAHGPADQARDGVLTGIVPRLEEATLEVGNIGYPISPNTHIMTFVQVGNTWQRTTLVGDGPDSPSHRNALEPTVGWISFGCAAAFIIWALRAIRRGRPLIGWRGGQ